MKILFVSLGCDKNLSDSEVMLAILAKEGYEITLDEEEADIAVVNTCSFINDAKEESINTIIELGQLKETGRLKVLIASGCLSERYAKEIHTELPEIDALVGTNAIDQIGEVIKSVLEGTPRDAFVPLDKRPKGGNDRVITTGGYFDYLKIAEGCNKNCTYCIIPKIRGPYRSIPIEELVKEANILADKGVKELILVAQETTIYGTDLYGENMLPALLKELIKIEKIKWIRLLYCYPEEITDELIDLIAKEEKILNYIDMPIQSGSDAVLKRMGRRTDSDSILSLIERLRNAIPDICLRTTFITGFPGENDKDHRSTLDLIKKASFDRLGAFTYSQEEGTFAATYSDQISEKVKEKRKEEIMRLQQGIVFEKLKKKIGSVMDAIVVGYIPGDDVYVCRTYMDAPDVDGFLFVSSDRELISGDFIKAVITDANEYDLIGDVYEFTE